MADKDLVQKLNGELEQQLKRVEQEKQDLANEKTGQYTVHLVLLVTFTCCL